MGCHINLFADDTSVQQRIADTTSFIKVNWDLQRLTVFDEHWLIIFNSIKTECMIISRKRNRPNYPDLFLNGELISEVDQHTHLGVTFRRNTLSWSFHINAAIAKADRRLPVLRRNQKLLHRSCKEILYKTTISPVLDYADIIYDPCLQSESEANEKFQRKAALVCIGVFRITSNDRLLNELGLEKIKIKIKNKNAEPSTDEHCFTKLLIPFHLPTWSKFAISSHITPVHIIYAEITGFLCFLYEKQFLEIFLS